MFTNDVFGGGGRRRNAQAASPFGGQSMASPQPFKPQPFRPQAAMPQPAMPQKPFMPQTRPMPTQPGATRPMQTGGPDPVSVRPVAPPTQGMFKQYGLPEWWAAAGLGDDLGGGRFSYVAPAGQGMTGHIKGVMQNMPHSTMQGFAQQYPQSPWSKWWQSQQTPGANTPQGIGPGQEGPSNFRPFSGPGGATALPDQRAAHGVPDRMAIVRALLAQRGI